MKVDDIMTMILNSELIWVVSDDQAKEVSRFISEKFVSNSEYGKLRQENEMLKDVGRFEEVKEKTAEDIYRQTMKESENLDCIGGMESLWNRLREAGTLVLNRPSTHLHRKANQSRLQSK